MSQVLIKDVLKVTMSLDISIHDCNLNIHFAYEWSLRSSPNQFAFMFSENSVVTVNQVLIRDVLKVIMSLENFL